MLFFQNCKGIWSVLFLTNSKVFILWFLLLMWILFCILLIKDKIQLLFLIKLSRSIHWALFSVKDAAIGVFYAMEKLGILMEIFVCASFVVFSRFLLVGGCRYGSGQLLAFLFQGTWVWVLAPTWWLITSVNPATGYLIPFLGLQGYFKNVVETCILVQNPYT